MNTDRPIRIFVSFAAADRKEKDRLLAHLLPLRDQGLIEPWEDRPFQPIDRWDFEIQKQLDSADLVILLITPEYLRSRFRFQDAMQSALERHESGEAKVLPVRVRPCDFESTRLATLPAVPEGANWVSHFRPRNDGFYNVAIEILGVLESWDRTTGSWVESNGLRTSAEESSIPHTRLLTDRLEKKCPKRILSIDGGGVRGAIACGYIRQIEETLRKQHQNPRLRLCDYFDLIGGTSTGAIIAAMLATGRSAAYVQTLYSMLAKNVFSQKRRIWGRLKFCYDKKALEAALLKEFQQTTLGDASLKTGLCIVTRRADTGSTWPLINHPNGKFYDDNKDILLRTAVRASTAAPTYFKPELINVGDKQDAAMIDGGVSTANSPALKLFQVATLQGFPFRWSTGEDKLLLVSLGTGRWRERHELRRIVDCWLWDWGKHIPAMIMSDAVLQNHLMLQYLSRSPTASQIDLEVGNLDDDLLCPEPLLHYLRYNLSLERSPPEGDNSLTLSKLGLTEEDGFHPEELRDLDRGTNTPKLIEVGNAAAREGVKADHFPAAFKVN